MAIIMRMINALKVSDKNSECFFFLAHKLDYVAHSSMQPSNHT